MATAAQITKFINQLGRLAIIESNRRTGLGQGFVLPSVCIAQAAIETGWGTSSLMVKAHAYFGIKAGSDWTGKVYSSSTGEVYGGVSQTIYATFRAYDNEGESVADYYNLICSLSRYAAAVSYPGNVRTARDTVTAIKEGGYATDPDYVNKVLGIIDSHKLTDWDALVDADHITHKDNLVAVAKAEVGVSEPSGDDKYIIFYNENVGAQFALDVPWCAIFITYCARKAQVPRTLIPNFASVSYGVDWYRASGGFRDRDSYTPTPGDLIFFHDSYGASHAGIVEAVKNGMIHTVEGNSGDSVQKMEYYPNDETILGYGTYTDGYSDYNYLGILPDKENGKIVIHGTAPWKGAALTYLSSTRPRNADLAKLVKL